MLDKQKVAEVINDVLGNLCDSCEYQDECQIECAPLSSKEYFENCIVKKGVKMDNFPDYVKLASEIGQLVTEKQKAYGDSFGKSAEFLKLLYPDGIKPDQYGDVLVVVRIFDKLSRIANDKEAFGESPYRDIAGYGLLGFEKDRKKKKK